MYHPIRDQPLPASAGGPVRARRAAVRADCRPVTVVQVSGAASRAERIAAFGRPAGYPVVIHGPENGISVNRRIVSTSIDSGLSASADWDESTRLFVDEAAYVVSNTGDTDRSPDLVTGRVLQQTVIGFAPEAGAAVAFEAWLRDGVIVSKTNPYGIGIRKGDPALKAALDEWIGVNLANDELNDTYKRCNGVGLPEEMPA